MKAVFIRLISQLLVVSLILVPFSAQAALIGTGDVISGAQSQTDRQKISDFMARAEVQKQLQTFGLSPDTAKSRVNALTDEEVRQLAGRIDALPAGALSGWEVALIIVLGILAIYVIVH